MVTTKQVPMMPTHIQLWDRHEPKTNGSLTTLYIDSEHHKCHTNYIDNQDNIQAWTAAIASDCRCF